MGTMATGLAAESAYPVQVMVDPRTGDRNRLTTAFRLILAIPHLILVGGPAMAALTWSWSTDRGTSFNWGGGGIMGALATVIAIIAWFAILFTGRYPSGLWQLVAFYLRWRVRATAYTALLRDEYPPFGEAPYPAALELRQPEGKRDRLSVAFRIILAIPQIFATWAVGIAWGLTSIVAWFAILFTGRYPEELYRFGVGALRWTTRVEAYLLLLRDESPPFSLE